MASVELVVGHLTLVLIVVTIFVLCCLSCSCHVPLGKCIRCFCDEPKRCCRKQSRRRTEPETPAERRKREREAPVLAGRRRAPNADDEPPCGACLRAIPWVLTCGYCCGAFGDAFTTNRRLAESSAESATRREQGGEAPAVVMGQPVFEDDELGTGHAVTVAMPLLAVS